MKIHHHQVSKWKLCIFAILRDLCEIETNEKLMLNPVWTGNSLCQSGNIELLESLLFVSLVLHCTSDIGEQY